MNRNEILFIPPFINCPHCNEKIEIIYIAKYFGKIIDIKEEKEEESK